MAFFLPWQVMSHLAKERRVQLAAPPAPKYSEVARSETRSEGEALLGFFWHFFGGKDTLTTLTEIFPWHFTIFYYPKRPHAVGFLVLNSPHSCFPQKNRQGSPAQSVECMGFNPQDASVYGKRCLCVDLFRSCARWPRQSNVWQTTCFGQ